MAHQKSRQTNNIIRIKHHFVDVERENRYQLLISKVVTRFP